MTKSEYVYVIRGRRGSKVGIAVSPERRLTEQRYCGAIEIVKTWHRPSDARAVEYTTRQLLLDHIVYGFEWFDVPPERVIEAVESAIEMEEAGRGFVAPSAKLKVRREAKATWWRDWFAERDRLSAEVDKWAAAHPDEFEAEVQRLTALAKR